MSLEFVGDTQHDKDQSNDHRTIVTSYLAPE